VWNPILYFFGIHFYGSTSQWYNFWSGFGSDLAEFTIVIAVIAAYRKHNCHVKGCWRLQRHPVEGTPYIVCRRHHPTIATEAPTAAQVRDAHRAATHVA
jgi:hypothetical protein